MHRYFVELNIPDTDKTMGFYLYGDTLEGVTPENPFILSGDGTPYNFDTKVLTIDQTD